MRLTAQEEDLVRWLYVIAGFSRARLAQDFECTVADIEEIVTTGLMRILNPGSDAVKDKRPTWPQPQTVTPKLSGEQLLDVFRRALS